MDITQPRVIGAAFSFLVIFVSGYWMYKAGKPYGTIVLTIHKLIGLAVGVLLVSMVYQTSRASGLGGVEVVAVVVTGLTFIGLAATGGLLSADKEMPTVVSLAHHIAPYLAVLSAAWVLYLLLGGW
jgi:hypothetical protein